MRHLAKLATVGLSAGLLATACGGSTNVLQGKSPTQIIQLASSQIGGQSYEMAVDGKLGFDASGVQGIPADQLGQFTSAMRSFSMSGKADVQTVQRVRLNLSVSVAGTEKTVKAVLYDGHYYVSLDGVKYADAGTLNLQGLPISPDDIKAQLTGVGDVKDLGATTHDGVRVEHLHATLSKNYMTDMLNKVGGSGAGAAAVQQMSRLFAQVISIKDGSIDAYVRSSDGRLESTATHVVMALDMQKLISLVMGAFGGRMPSDSGIGNVSGSLAMTVDGTAKFSGYGSKITVTKPAVDPNAPSLPSNLFGGGM
jgi:hypothetical protein